MSAETVVESPLVNFELLEPIPVVYGYTGVAVSVVFFQSLNQFLLQFGSPTSVRIDEMWKWRNLFVSWVHAVIVGTWDLSCFYLYPELMTDLIAFHNIYLYMMVAFSTGYFLYDFIDIAANKQLSKLWEVVPHHLAVAGIFFYNVVQCRCIAYNVIALLAEVNSIFLHARKLLQMSGFEFSGWLYRANSAANLVSFVVCRFGGLAWIIYGMTQWNDRVGQIYLCLLAAAIFVLWVTNMILFWRLICSDLLRPQRQARPAAAGVVDVTSHVASPVHCNGTAVNGSLLGHAVNDNMRQQKISVANGLLTEDTSSPSMRRRGMNTANGSL